MSVAPVDAAIEHVNARLLGCAADGTTNDTTRFQAAVTLGAGLKRSGATYGRPIKVPDGVYLLDAIDLPAGAVLELSDGAVLKSRLGNTPILRVGAAAGSTGDVIIRGGKLVGTWDYDTYQGNLSSSTGGRKVSERLIYVNTSAVSTISNVRIEGVTFERAADAPIRIGPDAGDTIADVVIEGCRFIQCRQGPVLINDLDAAAGLARVTIRGCYLDETWDPGVGIKDATYGGNAITAAGTIDDVTVEGNHIETCGRITLELTPVWYNASTNRRLSYRQKIIGNYFGRGRYRTVSSAGWGATYRDNDIFEQDYIELSGNPVIFTGNRVHGNGIASSGNADSAAKQRDFFSAWTVTDNDFFLDRATPYETGAFYANALDSSVFSKNHIVVSSVMDPAATVRRAVIRVVESRRVRVEDNEILWTAGTIDRALLYLNDSSFCTMSRNHATVEATAINTDQAAIAADYAPFRFHALDRCTMERNIVRAATYLAVPNAAAWVNPGDPTAIVRRKFTSATAFTDTTCASAIVLNTPPGSPATNAVYLVGDVPTGAWVGHARTFATWNGSAWTFETITDLFNNLYSGTSTEQWHEQNGGAPTRATTGDVYAIVTNAVMVKSIIRDNIFDAIRNNLKSTSFANAITFNGGTANGQVAWQNTFTGNDLAADYATRGRTGIAT